MTSGKRMSSSIQQGRSDAGRPQATRIVALDARPRRRWDGRVCLSGSRSCSRGSPDISCPYASVGGSVKLTAVESRLRRVAKLTAKEVLLLKEGVSIEAALSRTMSDALQQVVADRIVLAESFLQTAETLRRSRSDLSRAAIARYYYSMYHAMRAVSFHHQGGDDHEAHSNLFAKGVPNDFPNAVMARNYLKDARLLRNEADYDPYPQSSAYFKSEVKRLAPLSASFVSDSRTYLVSKGNPHL